MFCLVILEMRVYAVYRKRKAVLVFMIILSIVSFCVDLLQGTGILCKLYSYLYSCLLMLIELFP